MQNNQLTSISGSTNLPPNVTLWYASEFIFAVTMMSLGVPRNKVFTQSLTRSMHHIYFPGSQFSFL